MAGEFIRVRSATGVAVIETVAAALRRQATVLDIGAGSGEPLTRILVEKGFSVSAIDASPNMVAAFRRNFPDVEIVCEPAETSRFFDRCFDAVVAVGLVFLLPEGAQRRLIPRMAEVVKPGGRLLFSAPEQTGSWDDLLTGQQSFSLGSAEYCRILSGCGMEVVADHRDEGGSHYYEARKPSD
ncbi:MAG: class I SAM-dependent methyltransferase [Pseudomonadota bacterium]